MVEHSPMNRLHEALGRVAAHSSDVAAHASKATDEHYAQAEQERLNTDNVTLSEGSVPGAGGRFHP